MKKSLIFTLILVVSSQLIFAQILEQGIYDIGNKVAIQPNFEGDNSLKKFNLSLRAGLTTNWLVSLSKAFEQDAPRYAPHIQIALNENFEIGNTLFIEQALGLNMRGGKIRDLTNNQLIKLDFTNIDFEIGGGIYLKNNKTFVSLTRLTSYNIDGYMTTTQVDGTSRREFIANKTRRNFWTGAWNGWRLTWGNRWGKLSGRLTFEYVHIQSFVNPIIPQLNPRHAGVQTSVAYTF